MIPKTVYKVIENNIIEGYFIVHNAELQTDSEDGKEVQIIKVVGKILSEDCKFDTKWGDKLISISLEFFLKLYNKHVLVLTDETDIAKLLLAGIKEEEMNVPNFRKQNS